MRAAHETKLFLPVLRRAALTLSVVSLPMLVDCDVDARTALAASIRAVAANRGVMLRWGVTVAVLQVLGSIPAFVGLAFVLPGLGNATWRLCSRLVDRTAIAGCAPGRVPIA